MNSEPLGLDISIEDKYGPAMDISSQEEAGTYFKLLVDHNVRRAARLITEAEKIERSNLGYYAGYYDAETRERVERLFQCEHPVLGAVVVKGQPQSVTAIEMGRALARRRVK